ncbi:DMT family transporter [Flavonifractor sp. DFI.6.63]|nr:DMT family transporter [Flavonifractor sp. DFI.6.63]
MGLLNSIAFMIFSMVNQVPFPSTVSMWGGTVLAAVMVWAAMYTLVAGISRIGATKASFFCIAEPVTSVVVSSLIFSYTLGIQEILGSVLMVCAMIFNALGKSSGSTIDDPAAGVANTVSKDEQSS